MRRTNFHHVAADSLSDFPFGLANSAIHPTQLDPPTAVYLLGDFTEPHPADWEAAWIDLGGEG